MKYKLKLKNVDFIILDEDDEFIIIYDNRNDLTFNYIIQYVPAKDAGRPNGLILNDNEVKEFNINISVDVFILDEIGNEIANLATYITSLAQIAIVNDEIQLNIKPFDIQTFDINENDLTIYDNDYESKKLIEVIKELLKKSNVNQHSFKNLMLKSLLSFTQLDDAS